ncbi:dirigent protein 1-like [Phragmites australis]|uniref:dirigent protein 1-like n=1 Tax=Phragmites australis TaxID=29695 RepID=UPI002D76911D|nr:dirigent protein 1-like [Phragmites australis]
MSTPCSPATLAFLAFLAAVAFPAAAADGNDGMTHLHLYIHETITGANATTALLNGSPLGGNSSFGSLSAIDDELREGSDPTSQYLGRAEGLLVQADLGSPAASCTILSLVFTDGDYNGSTLVVNGRSDFGGDGKAVVERGVVGGTGRFRRARGYSLMTKFGNPTPSTVVFEMELYVKIGV